MTSLFTIQLSYYFEQYRVHITEVSRVAHIRRARPPVVRNHPAANTTNRADRGARTELNQLRLFKSRKLFFVRLYNTLQKFLRIV